MLEGVKGLLVSNGLLGLFYRFFLSDMPEDTKGKKKHIDSVLSCCFLWRYNSIGIRLFLLLVK